MTTDLTGIADRIVVGVDGSHGSRQALEWAADESTARGAVVEAAIVWKSNHRISGRRLCNEEDGQMASEAAARLDEVVTDVLGRKPTIKVEKLVLQGDAALSLSERSADAVALVVGSKGHRALTGSPLGSVSMKCARHASSPLVIFRDSREDHEDKPQRTAGRIVVGVDRSPGSAGALSWAIEQARYRGWTIEAVEAGRDPYGGDMSLEFASPHFRRERRDTIESARERLTRFVDRVVGTDPLVEIRSLLVDGDPAATLYARSADADLLVVGSHGRRALAHLMLGSVSSRCARHSHCSVAIIPTLTSRINLSSRDLGRQERRQTA